MARRKGVEKSLRYLQKNINQTKLKLKGEGVYGINSVLLALQGKHRKCHRVLLQESKRTKDESLYFQKINDLAENRRVQVTFCSKQDMNAMIENKPHQGVILDSEPIEPTLITPMSPEEFSQLYNVKRHPVLLACDEMQDPQNFGAVIRSALYLGCNGVVASTRNNAPLSPAVSRASAGACEVLAAERRRFAVPNLLDFLQLKQQLGWKIVGACSSSDAIRSHDFHLETPTILVLGNEHRGMRTNIRRCCDALVKIPAESNTDKDFDSHIVDSLNVSVATGILLHQLIKP